MAREIVAAIGTGQTEFKRHHSDKTYVELAQSAAKTALESMRIGGFILNC